MLAELTIKMYDEESLRVELLSNLEVTKLLPLCITTLEEILSTCQEEEDGELPTFDLR